MDILHDQHQRRCLGSLYQQADQQGAYVLRTYLSGHLVGQLIIRDIQGQDLIQQWRDVKLIRGELLQSTDNRCASLFRILDISHAGCPVKVEQVSENGSPGKEE